VSKRSGGITFCLGKKKFKWGMTKQVGAGEGNVGRTQADESSESLGAVEQRQRRGRGCVMTVKKTLALQREKKRGE